MGDMDKMVAAQVAAVQREIASSQDKKEYGYGGADLVKPVQTLKTIEDALKSVANECKKDKFWADMATPADQAIARFKRMELEEDVEKRAKLRAEGMELSLSLTSSWRMPTRQTCSSMNTRWCTWW